MTTEQTTELQKVEPRKQSPEEQIRHQLQRMQPELLKALPKHMDAERLLRISMTTIRTTPKLLDCSPQSLLAAVMQAAQLGLEPGLLGQCYFVPYGKEVTFIPGYKGLMKLARRSGNIVTIQSDLVYRKDSFKLVRGYEDVLEHIPSYHDDRGELLGGYAYAITKDGGRYSEFMTKAQIDGIRNRSRAKDNGPWKTDYEQMARKTVIRRLCNYLDLEVEQMEALQRFDDNEFGERPISVELTQTEELSPTEQLKAKVEAKRQERLDPMNQGGTHPVIDVGEARQDEPVETQQETVTAAPTEKKGESDKAPQQAAGPDIDELKKYRVKSGGSQWGGMTLGSIPEADLRDLTMNEGEWDLLTASDQNAVADLLQELKAE